MEDQPRINILSQFSLWTVLLPYYCELHDAFLLLSSFNLRTRKAVMDNYDAFIFSMRDNLKTLEFNEEGKPMVKRIQTFKRLQRIPLDFFRVRVVLATSPCYKEFCRLLRVNLRVKAPSILRKSRSSEFIRISFPSLSGKPNWEKVLINAKILAENADGFCRLVLKTEEINPNFKKSLYILGKGIVNFRNGAKIDLPDFTVVMKKNFNRFLSCINTIDQLFFNGFTSEGFSEACVDLKKYSLNVESVIIPKETSPTYDFLKSLEFMKSHLLKINLVYSSLLPLQYHNLKIYELKELVVQLEEQDVKAFDMEIFEYLNEGVDVKIEPKVETDKMPLCTFGEGYFAKFNRIKQNLKFFKYSETNLFFDFDCKEVKIGVDENYFYLERFSNLEVKGLRRGCFGSDEDGERRIKRENFNGIDRSIINHDFKADEVLIFPLKYAKEFTMDTTSAGLTAFVDSLFTQKSYQKLIKSCKNSTIKTSTSDPTLHSYELLIALMPSNTTFEIQLSDENLSGPHILSRLETFAACKITVITLSHDKAIELFLAPSEVSRLATLLYTGSWAENLRVLQVYCEEESSSIKLLRAVTQLYNLKELELKWKNGGEKKAKGILKRRNEIFGKFQILDVCKINDDF